MNPTKALYVDWSMPRKFRGNKKLTKDSYTKNSNYLMSVNCYTSLSSDLTNTGRLLELV